jgi:hypothetical protein
MISLAPEERRRFVEELVESVLEVRERNAPRPIR